jgi:hypothetical protein
MRWMLVAAALTIAVPRVAEANGGNTHAWISLHAVEHLPPGRLKDMLSRPELQSALINGSVFPDGGYVIKDDYGEMAHWEPFVEAYIEWMREEVPHPFDHGAAAEYSAFLFGLASHGMADQVFDSSFVERARIEDAAGWSDDLLTSHDTATDVMLVAATGVSFVDTPTYVPSAEIAAIYRDRLGYEIDPGALDSAQNLLHRVVLVYGVSTAQDPVKVAELEAQYPWTAAHLMEDRAVGAPPCEGEVVAAYWLALWDRMHDISGEQNHLIATYPRDGSVGFATDHSSPEAQLLVVFGSGIQRAQLADRFTVVDSKGVSYDLTVDTQWGAEVANVVKIRSVDDWAAGETFTVTIKPGLELVDGSRIETPMSFSFSTAPGDPGAPTSDPTPHMGEPDVGEVPDAGCCSTGSGGSALLTSLVGLALTRRRYRRTFSK